MTVRWSGVPNHVGYAVQIGDGTPQGWGPAIVCPREQEGAASRALLPGAAPACAW